MIPFVTNNPITMLLLVFQNFPAYHKSTLTVKCRTFPPLKLIFYCYYSSFYCVDSLTIERLINTFKEEDNCLTTESLAIAYSTNAGPATASILRTPDAMPCSEIILNPWISDVLLTWVPPHNSIEMPGTSTTLTCKVIETQTK